MAITHDIGGFGAGLDIKFADSGSPDNSTSSDLDLFSDGSTTRCGFLRIKIPPRDTLDISNKAYLHL